jgi:uncharacterized membrane protein (UPF0127 family)
VNQPHPTKLRPRRFRDLPQRSFAMGRVPVAASPRSRLLGLAWLDRAGAPAGLLIPRCRAIHTFGMRFPLDLVFLDEDLQELSRRHALPPRRFAFERQAAAVLEVPA